MSSDSPFEFDYIIMGLSDELELLLRGKVTQEYNAYNQTQSEQISDTKREMEERILIARRHSASKFDSFRRVDDSGLKSARRRYQQALDTVPHDLNEQVFDIWRSHLQNAFRTIDDELNDRGINLHPAVNESDQVRDSIRKTIETIAKLEQDCEDEVRNRPEQEQMIRKIYRQAIDRVREQQ